MAELVSGLGGPAGYGEQRLEPGDIIDTFDVSSVFEADFMFSGRTLESGQLAVQSNGTVFFGPLNQRATNAFTTPFGNLHDDFGFGVYSKTPIWVDVDPVADKVTVTWEDGPVFRNNGVFSFQLELADLGDGELGVTFRYGDSDVERMKNGFTGVSGLGLIIDTNLDRQANLSDFGTFTGNTGKPGIWEWVINVAPIKGTSGADIIDGAEQGETILAFAGDDTVRGGEGDDFIDGGRGADTLFGEDGDDELVGGGGGDTLDGGDGNDRLKGGPGTDHIRGGRGDDWMEAGNGRAWFHGGSGQDTADFSGASRGAIIDLTMQGRNDGSAKGHRFHNVEVFEGSDFGDRITGDDAHSRFFTNDGDDVIDAGGGNDWVHAGAGDDTVFFNGGFGELVGDAGFDTLTFENWGAALNLKWTGGLAYVERVFISGFERYVGTDEGDYMHFARFYEGVTLEGGRGQDRLRGSAHDDTISGGTSRDWLLGDAGNDVLTGGAGFDVFLFMLPGARNAPIGHDVITDFETAKDRLTIRQDDIAGLDGFSGDVADLYARFGEVTSSSLTLSFGAGESLELQGVTDMNAAIAATLLI